MFPDLLFRFPVHEVALLYRPSEQDFAEVLARGELGSDVDSLVAISREAVRDDAWGWRF